MINIQKTLKKNIKSFINVRSESS